MDLQELSYRKLDQYKYQIMRAYTYAVPDGYLMYALSLRGANGWVNFSIDSKSFLRYVTFSKGYCWDGPSGPTYDTENFMRGSLVHDGLYQLMREHSAFRPQRNDADRLLERIVIEDGMSRARAKCVYWAVKTWGKRSAGG